MLPQAEPFCSGATTRFVMLPHRFCYLKSIAPWPTRFRQALTVTPSPQNLWVWPDWLVQRRKGTEVLRFLALFAALRERIW